MRVRGLFMLAIAMALAGCDSKPDPADYAAALAGLNAGRCTRVTESTLDCPISGGRVLRYTVYPDKTLCVKR